MIYFFILICLIVLGYVFFGGDERRRKQIEDAEYKRKFNEEYELKKREKLEKFKNLKISIQDKVDRNNVTPISIDISELPLDFYDKEYTAIDFETGYTEPLSAISLGIAHFKGNKLLSSIEYVFRPIYDETNGIGDFDFTYVHGKKSEDVRHLPYFDTYLNEIESHLNGKHLVAHNAEFDLEILKSLLQHFNKSLHKTTFSCTYLLAKRFMKHEVSYKLQNLCSAYEIPYWNHKSVYDAISCGILFMHTLAQSPGGAVSDSAMNGRKVNLKTNN